MVVLLVLAMGCGSDGDADTVPDGPDTDATDTDAAGSDPSGGTYPPAAGEVVTLDTRDGITLEGDLYAAQPGMPGFVLLHMTPSGPWSRVDWPASFIDRLTGRGWSVLAVDRRGAGASGGEAVDAYEGDAGRYDVEAAVLALEASGAGDLVLIGASNGTTSLVDYAVWAGGEGLPAVAAMGFMTGGDYTENQTAMESVPGVPAVFTTSTLEAAWTDDQRPLDPGSWSFLEYGGGDHGTLMFDAKPKVAGDLEDFFAGVL